MTAKTSFLGGDLGYRGDSSAAVRIDLRGDRFHVGDVREWKPAKGAPLVPSVVRAGMIEMAQKAGCDELALDLFGIEDAREQFSAAGIVVFELPNGQSGKLQMYSAAKELIHAKRVRIPILYRRLATQVKAVVGKATPGGGVQISSPRTLAGGHGDLASAFIAATFLAHLRSGVSIGIPENIRTTLAQLARVSRWEGMPRRGY